MAKIIVGLSGGVDSSVAAYLLKKQGHDVVGLFMINWHDSSVTLTSECSWKDDKFIAELVARKINIPLEIVDLSKYYQQRVVDYMFSEYEKGRTPNPDVLCNREIKFDIFLEKAFELGADYVATGHYCRKETLIINNKNVHRLLAGVDTNKDQSYFLCQLSQKQLDKALFPLGDLTKPEVRDIAKQNSLATADRKDSQGICFVGKVDLPVFLQQKLQTKKGNVIEIKDEYYVKNNIENTNNIDLKTITSPFIYSKNDGEIVGTHSGAHFFTIGQRKGIGIGGFPKPIFVIATDVENNILYVGQGKEHKGLYRKGLFIQKNEIHWIRQDLKTSFGKKHQFLVRIRYRQALQKASLYIEVEGIYIVFDIAQRGITSGQFAAWYLKDELIGSGVIDK